MLKIFDCEKSLLALLKKHPIMKFTISTLIILTFAACNSQNSTHGIVSKNDTLQLRNLKETDWPYAYHHQDTALLNRILHTEFELISNNGERSDKQFELNWIANNSVKPDSFRYEIKRLDLFDNGTAMISGTGHVYNDTVYITYESSNVLIKENNQWKAINSHVSGIKNH